MKQTIKGYHRDAEDHWVAELTCGHAQHVRHNPPWMERSWVTTEEGRRSRLGVELNCVRCDEAGLAVASAVAAACRKTFADAYTDAGMSGLCEEGRLEAAAGAVSTLNLLAIAQEALRELFSEPTAGS